MPNDVKIHNTTLRINFSRHNQIQMNHFASYRVKYFSRQSNYKLFNKCDLKSSFRSQNTHFSIFGYTHLSAIV